MKKVCLFFFIFKTCLLFSQVELKVLNSAALNFNTNNYAFDVSIGEVITYTIGAGNSLLTQGFLQTNIEYNTSIVYNNAANSVLVYPNPFENSLMIDTKEQTASFTIVDLTGRIVYEDSKCGLIPLGFLNAGIYTLTIINSYGSIISTYKICKIN